MPGRDRVHLVLLAGVGIAAERGRACVRGWVWVRRWAMLDGGIWDLGSRGVRGVWGGHERREKERRVGERWHWTASRAPVSKEAVVMMSGERTDPGGVVTGRRISARDHFPTPRLGNARCALTARSALTSTHPRPVTLCGNTLYLWQGRTKSQTAARNAAGSFLLVDLHTCYFFNEYLLQVLSSAPVIRFQQLDGSQAWIRGPGVL